jgi:hypothetical protein
MTCAALSVVKEPQSIAKPWLEQNSAPSSTSAFIAQGSPPPEASQIEAFSDTINTTLAGLPDLQVHGSLTRSHS